MIDKLKNEILKLIQINLKGYLLIASVFFAGVILSVILNISSGSEEEIKLYISDFISNVKNYTTDSQKTFNIAFLGYVKFVFFVFLMSVTIVGNVGIFIYVFVKGFSYGSVFVALFDMGSAFAFLFFVSAVLPHVLISIPCCISYLLHCAKKSFSSLKGIKNFKLTLLEPFFYGVFSIAILSCSALIQSYVEPLFIRFINFN